MAGFNTALSSIRTAQFAIDTLANNIANASTPGFKRRNIHLDTQIPNQSGLFQVGNGVIVGDVERVRSQVTEASLTFTRSETFGANQLLEIESQIESMFQAGEGSLSERLDNLFGEITKLTSTSDSATQRATVMQQATQLTDTFRDIAAQLANLKTTVRYQVESEVNTLNDKLDSLADMTARISILQASTSPNRELDQRDVLINEIAEIIDVSRQEVNNEGLDLSFAGTSIQQGITAIKFKTNLDTQDKIEIQFEQTVTTSSVTFNSGRLPALLEAYNEVIPEFEARLDELAKGVIQQFDQIHATGVGVDGSFGFLNGSRPVKNADVPLEIAGLAFPIEAGDLYVSVIDEQGNRKTSSIAIDPETDSLSDVAAALSAIDNLQATVNPQTNVLQIRASPDFTFDFTGNQETDPDLSSFTGTSIPKLSGKYDGGFNENYRFVVSGSGDVGISDDLVASVFDQEGIFVASIDIGNGYEAGSEVEVGKGIKVAFDPGTVVDGDEFSTDLVAESDGPGILAALGINSFFKGDDAYSLQISDELQDNIARFASGVSGEESDHTKLFDFIDLQDSRVLSNGRLSIQESVNEIQTDIGSQVKGRRELSVRLESLTTRYEQDRDAISGVDLNEELVKLQQFQRTYEAASRVIQTIDSLFEELFRAVG
jgi:flagellar hook-associated protein FlgK